MTTLTASSDRPLLMRIVIHGLLALAVGSLMYWLSCYLVAPTNDVGGGFEEDWLLMSQDPFKLSGRFPHRILVPFSAWVLGWGGDGYIQFTRGLHVVLLASVCLFVLQRRGRILDAVLVTAVVAITAPTQMYKLHWNGYTDPICYALFLWMMMVARNPWVFWSLFLVNLMNHELAGFLVPWLWYLRRREDGRWRLDLVCLGVACALYASFYFWVKASAQPMFNVDYFLQHPLFPGGSFVVWNLAAVHWVCAFGPVLAILAWQQHQRGNQESSERLHLWLVLIGITVIFCIAFDWTRHSNLLVLPLVVAASQFVSGGNRNRLVLVGLLALSVGLFWWVPPWGVSAWPTSIFSNPQIMFETGVAVPGPGPGLDLSFGPLGAAVGEWLPRIWKPLAIVHAIGIAIWCAGWAWARFGKRAA